MERIKSFTVDHRVLPSGIYESRRDTVGQVPVISYDLRLRVPNQEAVLETGLMHTIEHLGATYLRNHPLYKERILYFGPMGCRTGFYLLIQEDSPQDALFNLIHGTFSFIAEYQGDIPGVSPEECGNYKDHDLEAACEAAREYLKRLKANPQSDWEYPAYL